MVYVPKSTSAASKELSLLTPSPGSADPCLRDFIGEPPDEETEPKFLYLVVQWAGRVESDLNLQMYSLLY